MTPPNEHDIGQEYAALVDSLTDAEVAEIVAQAAERFGPLEAAILQDAARRLRRRRAVA